MKNWSNRKAGNFKRHLVTRVDVSAHHFPKYAIDGVLVPHSLSACMRVIWLLIIILDLRTEVLNIGKSNRFIIINPNQNVNLLKSVGAFYHTETRSSVFVSQNRRPWVNGAGILSDQ